MLPGILNEEKNDFLLGFVLAQPVQLAFPVVGEVTSALEVEGQCSGGKVGLVRVEASCGCIHIVPWAF